jgi:adenylate kinase family enzyme
MAKELHGDFPGKPEVKPAALQQIAPEGTTCIIGPPGCGKTTLRERLHEAAKYLFGYETDDMSQIMDWHKNPVNKSPFYADFSGEAGKVRSSGNLVNDLLVCQALEHRLRIKDAESLQKHNDHIRRLILSGVPRTIGQYETLVQMLPNFKLVGIELSYDQANKNRLKRIADGVARDDDSPEVFQNRWAKYYESTEPFIKWAVKNQLILMIKFKTELSLKCVHVIKHMQLPEREHTSMDKQIRNPQFDAHWSIKKIEDPVAFHKHMQLQVALNEDRKPAPQLHMAQKYFAAQPAMAS